ncbi:SMI1/KNR4 family protein [Aureibaculum marinum]|uniref:SMI1/KNR4 family protein n=1 Tax=Aureibaculum marinum TaxID=2487930 RepID=A0A3N4N2Y2_9FLAO|nr:SMI1/KNR4 family protein [Aureibaculum marinum]RPD89705.1 SMI1/KNR4 family protein [Aureibaculum marinum]
MIEEINKKFKELAEGKLTAKEWILWFEQNQKNVELVCGKLNYLKIKTRKSNTDIANAFYGQTAVIKWLQSKEIDISTSDIYEKSYNNEFDEYCKKEKDKLIEKRKIAKNKFGYLKEEYPKFYNQLIKSYDESTIIEKGVIISQIKSVESELSLSLTSQLITLFRHISIFEFEGIELNFEYLEKFIYKEKEFLILGEFWEYGDGDKLLYDIKNGSISVFAHEYNPPKIMLQAKTIKDFFEKNIVRHLKEYDE